MLFRYAYSKTVFPEIREKRLLWEKSLSITKSCNAYRLKFRLQVQIPTAVNNCLTCYKLSADGVSKLRAKEKISSRVHVRVGKKH